MSDSMDEEDVRQMAPQAWGRPPGPGWGRPPTGVWPPCPPGPPGPWPGGLFRLEQCWDDVKRTKALLRRMIADIIAEDPSLIGLAQPIIGVTDGSDAQPGQVGEYIQWGQTVPLSTAIDASMNLTMGVLPPGDWDCWASAATDQPVGNVMYLLNPVPAGFTENMSTAAWVPGTTELLSIASYTARALTSVPSLINFTVTYRADMNTNFIFWFAARRRR